jgi:hypothetical protein
MAVRCRTNDSAKRFVEERGAAEAPALQFVELRLNDEDCSLVMTLHDDAGTVGRQHLSDSVLVRLKKGPRRR